MLAHKTDVKANDNNEDNDDDACLLTSTISKIIALGSVIDGFSQFNHFFVLTTAFC